VLDVFGVRFQLGDHLVVELVRLVPERLLAFQNDHGRAVRVDSWNTSPTRFIAIIDGAESGVIDTACILPTSSS
jgi:hypothetical protein